MICPIQTKCSFDTETGVRSISLDDILWVDGGADDVDSTTRLHLTNQVLICRQSFEELLPQLGDAFLFCLNRGAVNELHISRIEADALALDTGERLPLSPFLTSRFREKLCRDLAHRVWED